MALDATPITDSMYPRLGTPAQLVRYGSTVPFLDDWHVFTARKGGWQPCGNHVVQCNQVTLWWGWGWVV